MPLAQALRLAARQGRWRPWTRRSWRRRVSIRLPQPFMRGVGWTESWPATTELLGSRKA